MTAIVETWSEIFQVTAVTAHWAGASSRLPGDDANSFEIEAGRLYLKAGTTLDYDTQASYTVAINTGNETTNHTLSISGVPTFNTSHDITNTVSALDVSAADIDGDGDLDVLSASSADNKLTWYENNGNASFTAKTISSLEDQPSSLSAADFDGDGHLDIVTASADGNTIAWYENDGNQSFTQHMVSTNAATATSAPSSFTDDFNDSSSTPRWSTLNEARATSDNNQSSWTFANNRAEQTSNIHGTIPNGQSSLWGTIHYVDNPTLAYDTTDVQSRVYSGDNDGIGVVARYSPDTGSHYRFSIRQQAGKAYLLRIDNAKSNDANAVLLNYVSNTYTKNQWFDMRLVVEGNQLTGYKDGVEIITAVDNTAGGPLPAGTAGIFSGGNTPSYFDDFQATGDENFQATGDGNKARPVYAVDLNTDGHIDILSASSNALVWYQNDGQGTFTEKTISSQVIPETAEPGSIPHALRETAGNPTTPMSSLKLWLDASNINATNNVGFANGDAISEWTDLSGNGNHATQASSNDHPTYSNDGAGEAISFDGQNNFFEIGQSDSLTMDTYSIFVVIEPEETSRELDRRLWENITRHHTK